MAKRRKIDPDKFQKLVEDSINHAHSALKNANITRSWLEIAKNDIEVAEILYSKGFYAASVYHLQQAYEKLLKGYYILTGRLQPNEVKNHDFIRRRLKFETTDKYIMSFLNFANYLNKNGNFSLDNVNLELEIFEKSEESIRNLNVTDFSRIMNLIENLDLIITNKDLMKKTYDESNKPSFIRFLKHIVQSIRRMRTRSREIKKELGRDKVEYIFKNASVSIKLNLISLFTFLHYNTPRYPYGNIVGDKTTNFYSYNTNLGIVAYTPELIKHFNIIHANIMENLLFLEKINNEVSQKRLD
jgi:hypothetical protein